MQILGLIFDNRGQPTVAVQPMHNGDEFLFLNLVLVDASEGDFPFID